MTPATPTAHENEYGYQGGAVPVTKRQSWGPGIATAEDGVFGLDEEEKREGGGAGGDGGAHVHQEERDVDGGAIVWSRWDVLPGGAQARAQYVSFIRRDHSCGCDLWGCY